MLRFGPDDLQAPSNFCRKMTRVSKIAVFSQPEPFAKRSKRIGFAKFQMLHGSVFNAVDNYALGFGFHRNSFFAILFPDPRILTESQKRAHDSL